MLVSLLNCLTTSFPLHPSTRPPVQHSVFGVTRNPWAPALSAGGSSGGSAAALAVGACWLATGSDLGGSLRNPAGWCGVVGIRPTPGLVPGAPPPRPPPAAAWRLRGVNGPMAHCVRDAALMLDAMAVPGRVSSRGSSGGGGGGGSAGGGRVSSGGGGAGAIAADGPTESYEAAAAAPPPRPLRVAFSADLGGVAPVDPEIAAACRAAAQWLSDHLGGTSGGGGGDAAADATTTAAAPVAEAWPDFGGDAPRLFSTLRALACHELLDLLTNPDAEGAVKPECLWQAAQAANVPPSDVAWAEAAHDALLARRDAFFAEYDLLVCPSAIMGPFAAETR